MDETKMKKGHRASPPTNVLPESELARLKASTLAVVNAVAEARTALPLSNMFPGRDVPDYPGRTDDESFFRRVSANSERVSFARIKPFLDSVMLDPAAAPDGSRLRPQFSQLRFFGGDTFRILRKAIEAYLLVTLDAKDVAPPETPAPPNGVGAPAEGGAAPAAPHGTGPLDEPGLRELLGAHEAYIVKQVQAYAPLPDGAAGRYVLRSKITRPMFLELIWSYWMEEGALAQTLNAISMRFQNRRVPAGGRSEALNRLETDPLKAINPLMWSFIQSEPERLSVVRRSHEYDHHYGLRLFGKATAAQDTADPRSNFLRAFHQLLQTCTRFYRQLDDLTVVPDAEPVFRGLQEVEMLLGEGMHNQYGDLPWSARVEMIAQQWMLSLPEMDKFLGGRENTPYPEKWMDRVETMKGLMGWGGASVLHFRELAVAGEVVLLTVRFGDWIATGTASRASLWARTYRDQVTRYLHAYRAVTGVDLSSDRPVDATLPGVHLSARRGSSQAR